MPRSTIPLLVLLALLALVPAPGRAQAEPAPGGGPSVGALAEPTFTLTSLNGRIGVMAGGTLALHVGEALQIGGGGHVLLRSIGIEAPGSAGDTELRFGYGGVVLGFGSLLPSAGLRWSGSLLVGAGTARVRSPLLAAELGSDNVLILEPRAEAQFPLTTSLAVGVRGSYRAITGVSGLPGVSAADLRGPAASLFVRVARRP